VAVEVPGFLAAGLACGIKPSGKPDLALIVSDRPAAAAATSQHRRASRVSRSHPRGCARRVVNGGVRTSRTAHAAWPTRGQDACWRDGAPARIQVASTGVIGHAVMEKLARIRARGRGAWRGFERAASAILTTDNLPGS
jgi:glutamate N-acetyltransferase/amino-acid N-acetyltransferase